MTRPMPKTLEFPYAEPPKTGEVIEVRPGIFWARLALPFRLNHVNIYLVEEAAVLALIDTGIDNHASRAAWEALLEGPLAGRRLDAHHRHPLPSRPHRPRRLALRALRSRARDEPDGVPHRAQHPPRPAGPEVGALPKFLPVARPQRRGDRDPARPRPELSAHGGDSAENLSAPDRRGPDHDRRTHVRGDDGGRPFARAGHALLGR